MSQAPSGSTAGGVIRCFDKDGVKTSDGHVLKHLEQCAYVDTKTETKTCEGKQYTVTLFKLKDGRGWVSNFVADRPTIPPVATEDVLFQGQLSKAGEGTGRFFLKKRHFVLTNFRMQYYEDERCTASKGEILLQPDTAVSIANMPGDRLDLMPAPGGRTFMLTAKSPTERDMWVKHINSAVRFLQQQSSVPARPKTAASQAAEHRSMSPSRSESVVSASFPRTPPPTPATDSSLLGSSPLDYSLIDSKLRAAAAQEDPEDSP